MIIALILMFAAGVWFGFTIGFARGAVVGASANTGNKPSIIPWCLLVAGSLALLGGLTAGVYRLHFVSTAIRTSGTIVEIREREDRENGGKSYVPVFTFADANGQRHQVSAELGTSQHTYRIGDELPVLYNPNHPKNACIESFAHLWLLPTVLAVISIVTLPIGAVWLLGRQLKRA